MVGKYIKDSRSYIWQWVSFLRPAWTKTVSPSADINDDRNQDKFLFYDVKYTCPQQAGLMTWNTEEQVTLSIKIENAVR